MKKKNWRIFWTCFWAAVSCALLVWLYWPLLIIVLTSLFMFYNWGIVRTMNANETKRDELEKK